MASVSDILGLIVKPEFQSRLSDWQEFATESEILGLRVIAEIYSTKGRQKARTPLPYVKQKHETHQSLFKRPPNFDLSSAEEHFRRKQMTTSYQFYHGGLSASKKAKSNIFSFKTLQKLELARPLTVMTVSFIDNWLSLKDSLRYEQMVLQCLRSLNNKIGSHDPHSTTAKSFYNWKEDWSLSKPVRMDLAGEDLTAFKPNLTAIRKQEEKMRETQTKLKELITPEFLRQMSIYKDFKIN